MYIRIANKNDVDRIYLFYKELFSYLAFLQPDHYKTAEPNREYLSKIIDDDNADFLLAVRADADNETILGFAFLQEQETQPFDCLVYHKFAHLMDILVTQSFRGKGAGTALVNAAKQWGKNRGLDYLVLNVLAENKNAMGLYEHEQFQKASQIMRFEL